MFLILSAPVDLEINSEGYFETDLLLSDSILVLKVSFSFHHEIYRSGQDHKIFIGIYSKI